MNVGGMRINMQFELTASMMCADFGHLEQEIRDLEEGGIDFFHIDIMDGHYVPNYAVSLNDMCYIAGATQRPFDVHLMIEHPNNTIALFWKIFGKTIPYTYIRKRSIIHPQDCRKSSMTA